MTSPSSMNLHNTAKTLKRATTQTNLLAISQTQGDVKLNQFTLPQTKQKDKPTAIPKTLPTSLANLCHHNTMKC